ncbi:hypothetical protein K449DRAFT_437454 [Hypoxylon sp. EC38]|nr:hypothetical protein K449DRAFT_437454 [Hypoxylon sp. EC38]
MWDLLNPDRHCFHGSKDLVQWGLHGNPAVWLLILAHSCHSSLFKPVGTANEAAGEEWKKAKKPTKPNNALPANAVHVVHTDFVLVSTLAPALALNFTFLTYHNAILLTTRTDLHATYTLNSLGDALILYEHSRAPFLNEGISHNPAFEMYSPYGSYSSMSSAAQPMEIPTSSYLSHNYNTAYTASCAFPSWPQRSSLTDSHEQRATSYLSDDDLFPFDDSDDAHSVSSAGSTTPTSPVAAVNEADLLQMQREQMAMQREAIKFLLSEKERRRQQMKKQRRSSSGAARRAARRRKRRTWTPSPRRENEWPQP